MFRTIVVGHDGTPGADAWAASLILAAALDFARPAGFKPGGGD